MSTSPISPAIRRMPSCFQPADHARPDREEHVPLFAAANSVDEAQSWATSPLKTKEDLLLCAAACNEIPLCKDLIAKGVDVNKAKEPNSETPLMWAAKQGNLEIVKLLVEAGAKPNAKNSAGSTPLMYAAFNGDLALCTYLIQEVKADVLARDKDDETALDYALQGGEGAGPVVSLLKDTLAQKAAEPPTLIGSLVVNNTPGPESLIADFLGEQELAAIANTSKGFQALERQSKVYASTVVKIDRKQGDIQQALQRYLKKDNQNNLVPNTRIYKLDLSGCNQLTNEDLHFVATFFPHLKFLTLESCHKVEDEGLVYLRNLNNLQHLNLSFCNSITDAGLVCLSGLNNLQHLNLSNCKLVTNAGLARLQYLTSLQHLNLTLCNLSDAGLVHLQHLTSLRHLSLEGCKLITDEGLAHLQHLTSLQYLSLRDCNSIRGAGFADLQHLTSLQHLSLEGCDLTDEGLAHLQYLTSLQYLNLNGCWLITGAGFTHLQPLLNLKELYLKRCKRITDAGLAHLKPLQNLNYLDLEGCRNITNAGRTGFRYGIKIRS